MGLFNFWRKKPAPVLANTADVAKAARGKVVYVPMYQTPTPDNDLLGVFSEYKPNLRNHKVWEMIRIVCPICDIAIKKINYLIGNCRVVAETKSQQELVDAFIKKVKVNDFQSGFATFMHQWIDSTLQYGTGYVEAVAYKSLTGIYKLKNVHPRHFAFMLDKEKKELKLGVVNSTTAQVKALEYPDLVRMLVFESQNGQPEGLSLFYGLPFLVQAFGRGVNMLDKIYWRKANMPYFIKGKPADADTYDLTQDAVDLTRTNWETSMQNIRAGKTMDIFTVAPPGGDITAEQIGNEGNIMQVIAPIRDISNYISAKLYLPDWMLGLKTTTTEELSRHEADMLTSILTSFRSIIENQAYPIFDIFFTLTGNANRFELVWDEINLQDKKGEAEAKNMLYNSWRSFVELQLELLMAEIIDSDEFKNNLINEGILPQNKRNMNSVKVANYFLAKAKEWQAQKLYQKLYPSSI